MQENADSQPSAPEPPVPPTPPDPVDKKEDIPPATPKPPDPQDKKKDTPSASEDARTKYSSRLFRIAASALDGLVVAVPLFFVAWFFGAMGVNSEVAANLFGALVGATYAVVALKLYSKTVGKHVFGLKVVKEDSSALGWGSILIRETIGKFLSSIVFSLGYIWILFDSKRQGWHDKLAKTVVIQEKEPGKGRKVIAYIIVFALPVIAILGILAAIVLVAINPAEQFERARTEAEYYNSESLPTLPPVD